MRNANYYSSSFPKEKATFDKFCESCISLKRNFNLDNEEESKEYLSYIEKYFKNYLSKANYNYMIEMFNKVYPLFNNKENAKKVIGELNGVFIPSYSRDNERQLKIASMIIEYIEKAHKYFKKEDIFIKVIQIYIFNSGNKNYDSWFSDRIKEY